MRLGARGIVLLVAAVGVLLVFVLPGVPGLLFGRVDAALGLGSSAVGVAPCRFRLPLRELRSQIPEVVGDCLENERLNPENGDTLQRTKGGLLVWRRSDSVVAFTDGARTWARAPGGAVESRWNSQRFEWEAPEPEPAATAAPAAPVPAAPPPSPTAPARVSPEPVKPVIVTTPRASPRSGADALSSLAGGAVSEALIIGALKNSGLPVVDVQAVSADTDPEKLFGKPNGYMSKVVWRDTRAGQSQAAIELFADDAALRARVEALEAAGKRDPASAQHVFMDAARRGIVRVPKELPAEQARLYQQILSRIG